jgi:hypothetical protein
MCVRPQCVFVDLVPPARSRFTSRCTRISLSLSLSLVATPRCAIGQDTDQYSHQIHAPASFCLPLLGLRPNAKGTGVPLSWERCPDLVGTLCPSQSRGAFSGCPRGSVGGAAQV